MKTARAGATLSLLGLSLSLLSCAAAQPTSPSTSLPSGAVSVTKVRIDSARKHTRPLIQYGARCYNLHAQLTARRRAGSLSPIKMRALSEPNIGSLTDAMSFAKSLVDKRLRHALVVGLGGVGKSTFARAIEGTVCDQLPTIRLDLQRDVALHKGKLSKWALESNPILAAAALSLNLNPDKRSDARSAAAQALGEGRWLLILDSLDEVSVAQQAEIIDAIAELPQRAPMAQVVMLSRPPVHRVIAKMKRFTAPVFELEPRQCEELNVSASHLMKRPSHRRVFARFIASQKLDRKVHIDGACYSPNLMTWRDLAVVAGLSYEPEASNPPRRSAPRDGSRYSMYEAWVEMSLRHANDAGLVLKRSTDVALRALDALTDAAMKGGNPRSLEFNAKMCARAIKRDADDRCAWLQKSSVIKVEKDSFHPKNQSISDWLIARALVRQARGSEAPCETLLRRQALFSSSEVVTFTLGTPTGRRCLSQLTTSLCAMGGAARHTLLLLERGLPWTADRDAALTSAIARLNDQGVHARCARDVLSRVSRMTPVSASK